MVKFKKAVRSLFEYAPTPVTFRGPLQSASESCRRVRRDGPRSGLGRLADSSQRPPTSGRGRPGPREANGTFFVVHLGVVLGASSPASPPFLKARVNTRRLATSSR